jgi:hypothetical protein
MVPNSVMRLYAPPPGKLVSIIILAHNQLRDTQHCLASIEKHTPLSHELILVDNGSTDGTGQFFRNYAAKHSHVRVILNRANLGFSAGNNQGLACARGDAILLLNNDTVVTPGWLERMLTTFGIFIRTAAWSALFPIPFQVRNWCPPPIIPVWINCPSSPPNGAPPTPANPPRPPAWSVSVFCSAGPCWKKSAAWTRNLAAAISRTTISASAPAGRVQVAHRAGFLRASHRRPNFQRGQNRLPRQHGTKLGIVQSQVGHAQGRSSWTRATACPPAAPEGLALRQPLPDLKDSHTSSLEGRCWTDKTLPERRPEKIFPPSRRHRAPSVRAARPPWRGARTGSQETMARSLDSRLVRHFSARPYHPEAYLLLAEIARGRRRGLGPALRQSGARHGAGLGAAQTISQRPSARQCQAGMAEIAAGPGRQTPPPRASRFV